MRGGALYLNKKRTFSKNGVPEKGFTLVELLAVILILGIIISCAFAAVMTNIKEAHKEYYASQEKMVTMSGREYFSDYRSQLPKEIGPVSRVSLKTLIKEKYIEEVVDYKKNACDYEKSYVYVQKQSNNTYQYYTFLKCSEYDGSKDGVNPSITFVPNSKKTNQDLTVVMQIRDDQKVEAYSYILYKNNQPIRQIAKTAYRSDVKIKLTEEGSYKIIGTAYDSEGNIATRTSGTYLIDKTPPNCGEIQIVANVAKETWTSKDVELNMKISFDVQNYEWYEKKDNGLFYKKSNGKTASFSKKFTETGRHTGKIIVYDAVGNTCTKTTSTYYIDKTTTTVKLNGSIASGKLTNKDVRLTAIPSPATTPSGYTYLFEKKVGSSWTVIQEGVSNVCIIKEEGKNTYRVRVKTGAGNIGTSNTYETNIDKTPPDCSTISFVSNVEKNIWSKDTISITIKPNNNDIASYDVLKRVNEGAFSAHAYNRVGDSTISFASSGTYEAKVKAYDEANNSCEKESDTYYMDLEPPVISKFAATTRDSYQSLRVKLSIAATDLTAMKMCISQTGYEKNCTYEAYATSKNLDLSGTLDGKERTIYITVQDTAGNKSQTTTSYTPYKSCSSTRTSTTNGSCRGACGTGSKTITTTYYDVNTGDYCKQTSKEESCSTGIDCCGSGNTEDVGSWTDTSTCQGACGTGKKTQKLLQRSKLDTSVSCPAKTKTVNCNTGIDCCGAGNMERVGNWIDTTACNVSCGTGTKKQKILRRSKLDTSVSCPDEERTTSCDTGVSCCTGPTTTYGAWSSCSASCGDSGVKTRTKTVTQCDGTQKTTTESQACNRIDCCSSKETTWSYGSWTSCKYELNTQKRRRKYHKSLLDSTKKCDSEWEYSKSGCCSESNPTACTSLYPCRAGITDVYDSSTPSSAQAVQVKNTNQLYILGQTSDMYKIYAKNGWDGGQNPWFSLGKNIGWIYKKCTGNGTECDYTQCPG